MTLSAAKYKKRTRKAKERAQKTFVTASLAWKNGSSVQKHLLFSQYTLQYDIRKFIK